MYTSRITLLEFFLSLSPKALQETQRIDLLKLYKQNFFKSSFFVTFNIESCCCVSAGDVYCACNLHIPGNLLIDKQNCCLKNFYSAFTCSTESPARRRWLRMPCRKLCNFPLPWRHFSQGTSDLHIQKRLPWRHKTFPRRQNHKSLLQCT